MTDLLSLIANKTTLRKQSSREYAGACPLCGGDQQRSDRLRVFVADGKWWCRKCDQGGDAVSWLRKVEGMTCPAAHAAAGQSCTSTTCSVKAKCSHGIGGAAVPRRRLDAPADQLREFVPETALVPEAAWREKAGALVNYATDQLLSNTDQLTYLAQRGISTAAVEMFKLGYLPADLFRPRAPWGLPVETKDNGQPKKLLIPHGIVIPYFDQAGVHRIRIRREHPPEGHGRYYWLPGSGNDVVVINDQARAFVVVESDLDALLIAAVAGDLVGAVPLGSVAVKPKARAADLLDMALVVLVALDQDEAGAKAWPWWEQHYRRAARWPVPAGKDPGDFVRDHGGDVRAWVLDGLRKFAPILTIQPERKPSIAHDDQISPEKPSEGPGVVLQRGVSRHGVEYAVVACAEHVKAAAQEAPGAVIFTVAELDHCRGMSAEEADAVMLAKQVFSGATVIGHERVTNEQL